MRKIHSIRIPVHGFVEFDDWERDIINHPVFQRLRRIRQLALADYVYPGANHTRFEHSLGVMHIATRLYDAILERFEPILEDRLNFDPKNTNTRQLVRVAALLHDVGHAPFSHTAECLMPNSKYGTRLKHEHYSQALIEFEMRDVLDSHPRNQQGHSISAERIAAFLRGDPSLPLEMLFWRDLIDGQLDADRMDYLLRDSLHCGVTYGYYDLDRVVDSVAVVQNHVATLPPDLKVAVSDGGRHAAEGLILARYFMFQQVYFHPVRLAYNHHVANCLKNYLERAGGQGVLPDPHTSKGRKAFLQLDDVRLLEFILHKCEAPDADAIKCRAHDRRVDETSEVPNPDDLKRFDEKFRRLKRKGIRCWTEDAGRDWYAKDHPILVAEKGTGLLEVPVGNPLTQSSAAVGGLKPTRKQYLFVPLKDQEIALGLLR